MYPLVKTDSDQQALIQTPLRSQTIRHTLFCRESQQRTIDFCIDRSGITGHAGNGIGTHSTFISAERPDHSRFQLAFMPCDIHFKAASCPQAADAAFRPGIRQRRKKIDLTGMTLQQALRNGSRTWPVQFPAPARASARSDQTAADDTQTNCIPLPASNSSGC